jgi:phosphoribosyl-AMP cyclohydrolase
MGEIAGWDDLKWSAAGLIPAIVQDENSGAVLMFAWMNREALHLTLQTGEAHFWSRSRAQLWHKGETSGHIQRVSEVKADCDGDVLLLSVIPAGPACHTGHASCFFRRFVPTEEGMGSHE